MLQKSQQKYENIIFVVCCCCSVEQLFLLLFFWEIPFIRYGGHFFYMKNRRTRDKGYVYSPYVAEKGSMECEP